MISSTEPKRVPQPAVAVLRARNDPAAPALALVDEEVDFGATRLTAGRAFSTGDAAAVDAFADDALPVAKNWVSVEGGRKCLVEQVAYGALRDRLARTLPQARGNAPEQRAAIHPGRTFPAAPQQARLDKPARPMQMAARSGEPGFIIDYEQVANGTGWIFKGDRTYYVSSSFYLTNVVIEGGSVIKAAPGTGLRLRIQGPVDCQTSLYRPAIFTAKDDDSVGELIDGSSGIVTNNTYYGQYLEFYGDANSVDLHDLQMRYAYYGVNLTSYFANRECVVRNAQFTSNYAAITYGATNRLRNVLVADGRYTMGGGSRLEAEHLTAHRMMYLRNSGTAYVTNSLLVAVTNSSISGLSNAVLSSDAGVFQTVGAGGHYLGHESPYRDAGATNISPGMKADLSRLTTRPPQVLTNVITTNTVFAPMVDRDTDRPDLGYHYPVVDFAMNSVVITNQASVTIEPGVAIAAFGEAAFCLEDCAELICEGDALNRIQFTRFNSVQEKTLLWGGGSSFRFFRPDHGLNTPATVRLRFVDFHLLPMPYTSHHLYSGYDFETGRDLASSSVRDCAFYGGAIELGSSAPAWGFTNNLIERAWFCPFDASAFAAYNNFMRGGTFDLWNWSGSTNWTLHDNAFQEVAITDTSSASVSHNAYIGGSTYLFPTGDTDKFLTNMAFAVGPLGRYYQPANSPQIIDQGSRTADLAQLYHFTTTTDQVKELNGTVDIGLHYMAVTNIAGIWYPIDSDGDGVPDYLEDANGNGVTDAGETSFLNPLLNIISIAAYTRGGPPTLLDTNATVQDSDSRDLGGGQLRVTLTSGADASDQLSIRNQGTNAAQIGVSGGVVTYAGIAVATVTGGSGTNSLVVSFNTNATPAAAQALVRNLTFYHPSSSPPDNNRIAAFNLTDGDGGTNALTSLTIQVLCPAVIDAMIVFDVSASIWGTNFAAAKLAASNFVSLLNLSVDRVGLISFAENPVLEKPLINDAYSVQTNILGLARGSGTLLQPAIDLARTNLSQSGSNVSRVLVLLSDGETEPPSTTTTNALQAAARAAEAGIRIISLSCLGHAGNTNGTNLMRELASSPHDYYFAPVSADFQSNFTAVATSVCREETNMVLLVDAGSDQLINVSNQTLSATMAGVASVNGLPSGSLTYHWSQDSGIGAASFSDPTGTNGTVTFSAPGNYVLRLAASDGVASAFDTVTITFNQPPIVSAGFDRVVPPGTNVFLAGTIRDDALPVGGALTSLWTVVDGPPGVTLGNSMQTNSSVYFPSNGTYTLRLTAGDGATLAFDEVTFTVRGPQSRTFTRNVDFAQGMLVNLNYDAVPDQLQLNTKITPFPFVAVPCTGRGTVVRIDAESGQVLGEYLTCPPNLNSSPSPSRTTVDRFGNFWVANRDALSVTRMGLVIGGTRGYPTNGNAFVAHPEGDYLAPPFLYNTCIDRNGDGYIRTSRGLSNALAWNGPSWDAAITTNTDEVILNFVPLPWQLAGVRTIAIDANNDVWVGGYSGNGHIKIDGVNGQVITSTLFYPSGGGYGGLIDSAGVLWSAGPNDGHVLRFDTANPSQYSHIEVNQNYGLGIDPFTGNIWVSRYGDNNVSTLSPQGELLATTALTYPRLCENNCPGPKGVAVDERGNVWVAIAYYGGNYICHLRTDGTYVGEIFIGCGMDDVTGVAVDHRGKVWATVGSQGYSSYNRGTAIRIDSGKGPIGAGGYRLGAVDLAVELGPDAYPYTYSDMTGYVVMGSTAPGGFWIVTHDGGQADIAWRRVKWSATEPEGTSVKVELRAANAISLLSQATFTVVTNDTSFSGISGRYAEVRVTLSKPIGTNVTPILYDLTLSTDETVVSSPNTYLAQDDLFSITNNSAENLFNVLDNDPFPPGQLLLTGFSPSRHGVATLNASSNAVLYTPTPGFSGVDSFAYSAVTSDGRQERAMVQITVREIQPLVLTTNIDTNSLPVAVNDTNNAIRINSASTPIYVLANDTSTGACLTVTHVTQPEHGMALAASDRVLYTPNLWYAGEDFFSYIVSDSAGNMATAQVYVATSLFTLPCATTNDSLSNGEAYSAFLQSPALAVKTYVVSNDTPREVSITAAAIYSGSPPLQIRLFDIRGDAVAIGPVATNSSMQAWLAEAGAYTVEIAMMPKSDGSSVGSVSYWLTMDCSPSFSRLDVYLDGKRAINGSVIGLWTATVGNDVTVSLLLSNAGTATLSWVDQEWPPAQGWAFDDWPWNSPFFLATGATTNFTMRFTPQTAGFNLNTLRIIASEFVTPFTCELIGMGQSNATMNVSIVHPETNSLLAVGNVFFETAIDPWSTNAEVHFYQETLNGWLEWPAPPAGYTSLVYTITAPGEYSVMALAYNPDSGSASTSAPVHFVITNALEWTTNADPVAVDDVATFKVTDNPVSTRLELLANDWDPNGDPLTVVSHSNPRYGRLTRIGNEFYYTPPANTLGNTYFFYTVTDGKGRYATAQVTIVLADFTPPTISVVVPGDNEVFHSPGPIPLRALVSYGADSPAVARLVFRADGRSVGEGVFTNGGFAMTWSNVSARLAPREIDAEATDANGDVWFAPAVNVYVLSRANNQLPTATITSPASVISNGVAILPTIRTGTLDVIGTTGDPDGGDTVAFKLQALLPDGAVVADLTPPPLRADGYHEGRVTSASLGTLDLSRLQNGVYDLELEVFDGSDVAFATARFILESDLKLGQLTFSEQDLVIPAGGVPLTVTRTYDSLDPRSGDFGFGWTYSLKDMAVQLDEDRTLMPDLFEEESTTPGGTFSLRTGGGRDVTLTLPNGRRATFAYYLVENPECEEYEGCFSPRWQAPLGVTAQLGLLDPAYLVALPGGYNVWKQDMSAGVENFEFSGFVLTNLDGSEYIFRRDDTGLHFFVTEETSASENHAYTYGEPYLSEIKLRNGERVVVQKDAVESDGVKRFRIQHYNATNQPTRQVIFERDARHRIVAIHEPQGQDANGNPTGPAALKYDYDNAGNLIRVFRLKDRTDPINPVYLITTYQYTNTAFPHYITGIIDPRGNTVARQVFDDQGRLIESIDASGRTNRFIHDLASRREIHLDRTGHGTTNVFDVFGNITNVVNALGQTNHFRYDTNGHLLAHTDPLGHVTTYSNDAFGNVWSITLPYPAGADPEKYTTRYTYDPFGNQTSITLPTGAVMTNEFNPTTGNLLAIRAGADLISSFSYDASGNVTAEMDRFGTNGFYYDEFGNARRMTNSLGQVTTSDYDANGQLTNLVANGTTSRLAYDALGRDTFADYGSGITLSNSYDSQFDWNSVDGPTIGHMERRFDEQGRLAGWTTANGATPGFAYTGNGQLEFETNSLGVVSHYRYDPAGRVVEHSTLNSQPSTNWYGYDAAGRRIAETNALGYVTRYGFNPDGSLAAMTNAFNTNWWLYAYDTGAGCCGGGGASVAVTDPLGRQGKTIRSAYGLPLETIFTSGSLSVTNKTTYLSGIVSPEQEGEEYPATITDEGGHVRQFGYTGLGQLERATDLGGNWWTNQFDATSGALLRVLSPTGETNSFVYDALDNLKTNRFSDGRLLVNFFNAENRLASNSLPSGALVEFHYDDASRVTNRNSSLGETASFRYNANDAVTIMTDNTGSTTNVYDSAGRLSAIAYPTGARVDYGYDLLGRITAITNRAKAAGPLFVTQYGYDALGNITSVTDNWNRVTTFEYDRVGRRTKRVLPNSVETTYEYDWRDRVTNIVHLLDSTTNAAIGYVRAPGGEPTRITREDGSYMDLKYDASLRLTNEVYYTAGGTPQTTNGYGYDAAGTRLRLTKGGTTTTNSVSSGYRITAVNSASSGATLATYGYDNGGRVTGMTLGPTIIDLAYNSADQLTAFTNDSGVWVSYTHDATGRRTVSTNWTGTVRRWLVAPTPGSDLESPHLIADANGVVQQGYVYLGDRPLIRFDTNGDYTCYLEDAMGSVVGLAGANGLSAATFHYDGFGNVRSESGATTAPAGTGGDYRFHGAWLEADSGLYNIRAREYDARMGRFTSRDPRNGVFQRAETLNPYAYAVNNPYVFTDPSGEFTVIEINVSSFFNATMQSLRGYTVNRAKKYLKETIFDAVSKAVMTQLGDLYPPLGSVFDALHNNKVAQAGRNFEAVFKEMVCGAIGADGPLSSMLWFYPGIKPETGQADFAGFNCPNLSMPKPEPGLRYPDFILSEVSPKEASRQNATGKSIFVGDFKLSGNSLYKQYVEPGTHRAQFDAVTRYAGQHTYTHTAVFLTVFTGQQSKLRQVQALLGGDALKEGVVAIVIAVKKNKNFND
jgi:RHS repeat-associated protein